MGSSWLDKCEMSMRIALRHNVKSLAVTALLISGAPEAYADDVAPASNGKPGLWVVTLGSRFMAEPSFEGARSHDFGWRPIIGWRRKSEKEWLSLPNDGLDYDLFETENFRAGPVANIRWLRGSDAVLPPRGFRSVGPIDLSVEAGAFAEFWPVQALRTRAEAREVVVGGKGLVVELSADSVWRPTAQWMLTAGPRVSFGDSDFMRAVYGVSAADAAVSGLTPFVPKAGVRTYGAGSQARYQWSENWTTSAFIEATWLAGSAADSPFVADRGSRDQVTAGVGFTYSFGVDGSR